MNPVKIKVSIVAALFISLPLSCFADSYLLTKQWWGKVEDQTKLYSEYIKDLYDKKGQNFCQYLLEAHPKSQCGTSVKLFLPPHTKITFDRDFDVTQITSQVDRSKVNYVFHRFTNERSFTVSGGVGNKISLRIDGDQGPRFSHVSLPDVVLKARQVAKVEHIKMPRHFHLDRTLNDIYRAQYSHRGIDMHEFVLDLVAQSEFRNEVFSSANLVRHLVDKPGDQEVVDQDLSLEEVLNRYDIKVGKEISPAGSRYCYISKGNYQAIPAEYLATVSRYYQVKVLD